MPHVMLRSVKSLHERTYREIVWLFCVFPILCGVGLLIAIGVLFMQHAGENGWQEWISAVWAVVMAAVLIIGLPGTGWRELQRRRQARAAAEQRAEFSRDKTPDRKRSSSMKDASETTSAPNEP